jgi:hypothetical protein
VVLFKENKALKPLTLITAQDGREPEDRILAKIPDENKFRFSIVHLICVLLSKKVVCIMKEGRNALISKLLLVSERKVFSWHDKLTLLRRVSKGSDLGECRGG